ncbi:MAG: signal recognition particle receptor subunit alpha [Candidatus Phytoplasma stylosanthis]|uniref:signal recognition particle receptor subunit alpha n=1 Tax=Candidatus Phytoplasma stylosanthis TaxID=2798314 RepID=UPI002939AD10|nr:signal recognition particle receptor subunit alpha [Candidatus Phytoplasma stylosanthis]MDV3167921.1 signal recognition particle receptor subunit alpha [Candidatus Phytoplasma stylosanthis]MDV3170756.1 signal recognition particle receptor subunit alpha [Candidatus Phytoplasma stylosanthis]MDV3173723.1 signal recognition particle receptor subunit alpha [Candidatus Phytoplasma stylosanthis]MDV3174013.1 signal recognition particle receptor subunit alpha [Candidatus Phytoplasma stylosanthis]MDV
MSLLNDSFHKIINKIKGKKFISSQDIEDIMKDIRFSFLEADVSYDVVVEFNELIKQKTFNKEVLKGVQPQEQVIKIIKDILTLILGNKNTPLQLNKNLDIILLIGLQGSGKTTVSGKLSYFIKKKIKKKVLLIAADIYRFGAIEQLKAIAKKIEVDFFSETNENVLNIIQKGIQYAFQNKFEVVIIDTAGRLTIDNQMIQEIKNIKKQFKPSETLIVVDSILGQKSVDIVKSFHKDISATGIILTKMDADVKGGTALSMKYVTKLPIKFISSSEKHDDDNFEIFHPERIASRLLDMGDMATLIENVEEKINIKNNKEIFNKILDEDYNYNDLLKQLKLLQRIGSVKKMLNFIPGMASKIKNLPFLEDNIIQKFRFIIQSMTIEERLKPILIENNNRRRIRIINGSGTKIIDINNLIQFIKKQKQISQQMRGLDLDNLNNPEDILKKIIN